LGAGIARLRAELHRFISGGIEEFLGFALFAKQNADFFRRRGGRKKLSLRFQ